MKEGLYDVDMEPRQAMEAARSGGMVLLLGVPPGTAVGLDHRVFTVAPKFMGFKMIPPGMHFLSTCCADRRHGSFAPVVGAFLHIGPGDVVVRRWDVEKESLARQASEEEEDRYRTGAQRFDFDAGLAPYDLRGWKRWRQLCDFIRQGTVDRVGPVGGDITIMGEDLGDMGVTGVTPAEAQLLDQLAKGRDHTVEVDGDTRKPTEASSNCFYTNLEQFTKLEGVSGAELTALHLDKSPLLNTVLECGFGGDGDELLGELQFAFISFLMCQSLQGLRQWKALVGLMLGCQEACLASHQYLFVNFSRCLRHQLAFGLSAWDLDSSESPPQSPGLLTELLDDSILEESFLKRSLLEFLGVVQDAAEEVHGAGVNADLFTECRKIRELIACKLKWEVEDLESGEYAPAVVEL